MPRDTDVLAVRLPLAEGAAIRALAAQQGRPYGELIRDVLRPIAQPQSK